MTNDDVQQTIARLQDHLSEVVEPPNTDPVVGIVYTKLRILLSEVAHNFEVLSHLTNNRDVAEAEKETTE
jgi:hypothetical protein